MDPVDTLPFIVHVDVADELVPLVCAFHVTVQLDASQEVVDSGQVDKGVDGPQGAHFVKQLHFLQRLSIDVDGEGHITFADAMKQLGGLVACVNKKELW